MLFIALALAGPTFDTADLSRLSWSLSELVVAQERGEWEALQLRRALPLDGISVVLEPDQETSLDQLLASAQERQWAVEAIGGGRVQVWIPYEQLGQVGQLPGLQHAREPWRATPKTITEGYDAIMAQDWHASGITGTGVKIGVVDVGFRGLSTLPAADRPTNLVEDFSRGNADNENHGTAVIEIINDFAPDAKYIASSFSTDVEYCEVIESMVNDGVDIINGSIGFDNVWHTDGTSSLTQCADWAVTNGVVYVAAAGNENDKYRVGELSYDGNDGTVAIADTWELWAYTAVGNASVVFRWSDPMLTSSNDLDIIAYNDDGTVCGSSQNIQDGTQGSYPVEIITAIDCSSQIQVIVYSEQQQADLTGLEGYFYGTFGIEESLWTNTEDLTLPGDTVDGVTVGAWYPETDQIAYYSSRGPTNDGRIKPDVVAPTAVSTETYHKEGFEGTSAATPHVTGLAALWIDATGQRDPVALKEWLRSEARDLGPAGEDNTYGRGAVTANEIPSGACGGCSPLGASAIPGLALWAWIAGLRLRTRR